MWIYAEKHVVEQAVFEAQHFYVPKYVCNLCIKPATKLIFLKWEKCIYGVCTIYAKRMKKKADNIFYLGLFTITKNKIKSF